MRSADTNPWLVFYRPRPAAQLRLFCFSYAGGGAAAYRAWASALPEHIEVAAVQLPGRESRYGEAPLRRMDDVIASFIEAALPSMSERRFAFFGHSLGAIVALELTRALARARAPQPVQVLLSARPAPHLPLRRQRVLGLSRDELIQWLRRVNGTPEAVLQSPELMDMFLPTLRADLEIDDTYRSRAEPLLSCPMTVLGGTDDDEATAEELQAWSGYTSGTFTLRMFRGGHFFAFGEAQSATLAAVADALVGAL